MTYYIENPFRSASTRDVVDDTNFIGREYNLQHIENRVILPPSERQRASIAIIGLPDVGKHCLINQVLLAHKAELHQRKLVPIEMDLATYTEADEHEKFFRDLMSLCKYELEDEDLKSIISKKIPNLTEMTRERIREWDEVGTITPLKRFFNTIFRAGIRVIFILNNFDHADSLFREHIPRIQWLRDLTGSQCQLTWIVLACKPIREIKRLPKSISDDFFDEHHLGMFLPEDMKEYFHLLTWMGVALTKEHEKTIKIYCGWHPYLLSLLGYHLIEDYAQQREAINVEQTFRKVEERFHRSYDRIIDLVLINDDNDEKLQKLWQVVSCPEPGVEQKDIDRLLAYNLIYPNPLWSPAEKYIQPAYVAFSKHFLNYLCSKLTILASRSPLEQPEQAWPKEDLSSPSQTMYPGEMILNRYRVIEKLGTTEHNQVVKALDTELNRYVAIKRLYLDDACDEKQIRMFNEGLKREAKILGGIKHDNIGLVYDIVKEPPTIIMEWIEGKSLDQYWRKKAFSSIEVVRLGIKLGKALEYIHQKKQQVIHRDIKPDNIIIRANGEPVLIDFDVAQAFGVQTIMPYDEHGNSLAEVGTRGYSAPEQFINVKSVTDRADIYALGVVLYEALTGGEKPHGGIILHPKIPTLLRPIIHDMLSQDPHDRPNAQQLYQKLERCLQELESAYSA